jgi:hypothetical protein
MNKHKQTGNRTNKQTDKQKKNPGSGTIEFQSLTSVVSSPASNSGVGI